MEDIMLHMVAFTDIFDKNFFLSLGDRAGKEAELPWEVGGADQAVYWGTQCHVPIGRKEPTELHHWPGQGVWLT